MKKRCLDAKHFLFFAACILSVAAVALCIVFACLQSAAMPAFLTQEKAVSASEDEFLFISDASVAVTDDLNGNRQTVDISKVTGEENASIVWAERRGDKLYTVTESKNVYVTQGEELLFKGAVTGIPQTLAVSEDGNAIAVVMRSSRNYSIGFFDLSQDLYNRIELDCAGQNACIRSTDEGYLIDVVKSDVEFVSYTAAGEKAGRRIIDDIPLSSCFYGGSAYILAENNVIYEIDLSSYEIRGETSLGGDHRALCYDAATDRIVAVDYTGKISCVEQGGRIVTAAGAGEMTGVLADGTGRLLLKTRTGRTYLTSAENMAAAGRNNICKIIFLCLALAFAAAVAVLVFLTFPGAQRGLKRFWAGVRKYKVPIIVLVPVALLVGFLSYYPAVSGLALAFMEYKPGAYSRFIGFQNFAAMFRNEYFWIGFKNLVIFVVAGLLKALFPPVVIALLILAVRSKRLQYFFRTALYIPAVLPGVAGLLLWTNGIYGPSGMLNSFVTAFGGTAQNWLGNTDTVIWMLILIGFPWVGSFLIFYGAFKGVPDSFHEAAKVEGAGYFKILFSIDIPLILPQIRYVLIMALISGVQEFNLVYFTTGGGPGNATYVPMLEIYLQVTKYQNYGVAAAMGVFMFIVLFSLTFVNLRLTTRKKEEQL